MAQLPLAGERASATRSRGPRRQDGHDAGGGCARFRTAGRGNEHPGHERRHDHRDHNRGYAPHWSHLLSRDAVAASPMASTLVSRPAENPTSTNATTVRNPYGERRNGAGRWRRLRPPISRRVERRRLAVAPCEDKTTRESGKTTASGAGGGTIAGRPRLSPKEQPLPANTTTAARTRRSDHARPERRGAPIPRTAARLKPSLMGLNRACPPHDSGSIARVAQRRRGRIEESARDTIRHQIRAQLCRPVTASFCGQPHHVTPDSANGLLGRFGYPAPSKRIDTRVGRGLYHVSPDDQPRHEQSAPREAHCPRIHAALTWQGHPR